MVPFGIMLRVLKPATPAWHFWGLVTTIGAHLAQYPVYECHLSSVPQSSGGTELNTEPHRATRGKTKMQETDASPEEIV